MNDIIERLRGKPVRHDYFPEADRQKAADEIERLTAENADLVLRTRALDTHASDLEAEIEQLRTALQFYAGLRGQPVELIADNGAVARTALEPKP